MAITAADINNQSFSIERKGYNVDEVDVFLERVASEIDELNNTVASLEKKLEEARRKEAEAAKKPAAAEKPEKKEVPEASEAANMPETSADEIKLKYDVLVAQKDDMISDLTHQLDEKKANDAAISQALIIAQRSADEIVDRANVQADETIQDARDEATRILNRANNDRQAVIDTIHKLEDEREDAREEYQDILRDFIADATRKLADLGAMSVNDGQGDREGDIQDSTEISPDQSSAEFLPIDAVQGEVDANFDDTGAAAPVASVYEKDLSGFGDADDFEFGEID